MADKVVTIKSNLALNLNKDEHEALKKATGNELLGNPVLLPRGVYTVSESAGASRFCVHPAILDHWYVRAHLEPSQRMPAHVHVARSAPVDTKASEAAAIREQALVEGDDVTEEEVEQAEAEEVSAEQSAAGETESTLSSEEVAALTPEEQAQAPVPAQRPPRRR